MSKSCWFIKINHFLIVFDKLYFNRRHYLMLYYSEMQNMQNICFINFTRKFVKIGILQTVQ